MRMTFKKKEVTTDKKIRPQFTKTVDTSLVKTKGMTSVLRVPNVSFQNM